MSRLPKSARLGVLADLQALVLLDRRRALADACTNTDMCRDRETSLADALIASEAELEIVHRRERLCLDRWRMAAALVGEREAAHSEGRRAHEDAQAKEWQASGDWLAARHRTKWFAERAGHERKKEALRIEEKAVSEAGAQRLARSGSRRSS